MSSKRITFTANVDTTQPLLISGSPGDGPARRASSRRNYSPRHISGKLATITKKEEIDENYTGYDYEPYEEELTHEEKERLINDSMFDGGDTDLEHDPRDKISTEHSVNAEVDEDIEEKYRKLDEKEKIPLFTRIITEIKALLWLALPISASLFIDNALSTLTTIFLGHMGARELAAGSLGLALANTTGWTLGNGLLTALDTQAAHAFGAGKKRRLGIITERAAVIITLFCIPIATAWSFTEEILVGIKQDPELAHLCKFFVLCMLPGLFPALWYECLRRHLQAMNITLPSTFIVLVSIPSQLCYLFLMIYVFELGLVGCPTAVALMYTTQFLMMAAYVIGRKDLRQTWPGCFPREVFKGWGSFIKLAIPSAIMCCIEGWGFDIMAFFAGWLGTIPLAVHSAMIDTYYLIYMIPNGFGYGATTRVGILLGSLHPGRAKLAFVINMVLTFIIEFLFALILISAGRQIGSIFCTDPAVINLYVKVVPFCCLLLIVDTFQLAGGAALRGLGLQKYGMVINFVAFYIIAIPTGFCLAMYTKFGLFGIWSGLILSDAISGAAFMVFLLFIVNWKKQAIIIAREEEEAKKNEEAKRANEVDEGESSSSESESEEDDEKKRKKRKSENDIESAVGGDDNDDDISEIVTKADDAIENE